MLGIIKNKLELSHLEGRDVYTVLDCSNFVAFFTTKEDAELFVRAKQMIANTQHIVKNVFTEAWASTTVDLDDFLVDRGGSVVTQEIGPVVTPEEVQELDALPMMPAETFAGLVEQTLKNLDKPKASNFLEEQSTFHEAVKKQPFHSYQKEYTPITQEELEVKVREAAEKPSKHVLMSSMEYVPECDDPIPDVIIDSPGSGG